MGLRYAGTQNEEATAILDQIFKLFLNSGSMYLTECAGKPTIETCLMLVLLASSLVGNGLAVYLTFGEQFKLKTLDFFILLLIFLGNLIQNLPIQIFSSGNGW